MEASGTAAERSVGEDVRFNIGFLVGGEFVFEKAEPPIGTPCSRSTSLAGRNRGSMMYDYLYFLRLSAPKSFSCGFLLLVWKKPLCAWGKCGDHQISYLLRCMNAMAEREVISDDFTDFENRRCRPVATFFGYWRQLPGEHSGKGSARSLRL